MKLGILFLGGAKRVSMGRKFISAALALGHEAAIYGYELSPRQPLAEIAEKIFTGLRWNDPEVDADLRRIIAENNIRIVVPFVDGAVAVAARLADAAFVPACPPQLAEQMFDKVVCAELLTNASLPVPATYRTGSEITMPLIAKPRHGSASKGIVCFNDKIPEAIVAHTDDFLIQERIDNRTEFTVDCYVSPSSGEILAVVPRERLEVSGGEVTRTRTVADPALVTLAEQTLTRLRLSGAVTVQIIRDNTDSRIMVMEINPRLGGGAVCAVGAGADIPAMIIADALGQKPSRCTNYKLIEMARYPAEVFFE